MISRKSLLFLFVFVFGVASVSAQRVALKTNLPYLATGTVNFAGEMAVAPRITIDAALTCNIPGLIYYGNPVDNRKIWHWTAQPEIRFWHTEVFNRGFVGIHAGGGAFDAGGIELPWGIFPEFALHRYEGWLAGAGVSYGRQWWLGTHWNLEATVGVGYCYIAYNRFASPPGAIVDKPNAVYHYFGPTRIGLSLVYLFRSKK